MDNVCQIQMKAKCDLFALQYLQQLAATGQLGSTFPQPPSHPYLIPGAGGPQTQVIVVNAFCRFRFKKTGVLLLE